MPLWRGVASALSGGIVRHRRLLAGLVVLSLIGMAATASRLSVGMSPDDFLLQVSPTGAPGRPPAPVLGAGNRVLVVFDAGRPISPEVASPIVARIRSRLEASPGVARVRTGPASAERQLAERQFPRNILLHVDPPSMATIAERLDSRAIAENMALALDTQPGDSDFSTRRRRDPLGLAEAASSALRSWQPGLRVRVENDLYTLPGQGIFLIDVETKFEQTDVAAAQVFSRSVDAILTQLREDASPGRSLEGARLYPVGFSVSLASTFSRLTQDLRRIASVATVVVIVLLWVFLRRLLAALVLVGTVATGVLATGAVAALMLGSINLVTLILVALVLGLGVDFGIYVISHYWVFGRQDASRPDSLAYAIGRPGLGIIVGSLTTAAAFACVTLIPSPITREIGTVLALGMIAILISSLIVLPLMLSFTPPRTRALPRMERWICVFQRTHGGPVAPAIVPWLLLLAGAVAAVPTIGASDDQWSILREDQDSAAVDALIADMGVALPPVVIRSRGATAHEALARDREVAARLVVIGLSADIAAVESLSRWLPALEDQLANLEYLAENEAAFSVKRVRGDLLRSLRGHESEQYYVEEYLPLIEEGLRPQDAPITIDQLHAQGLGHIVDRHLALDGNQYVAASYVYLQRAQWTEGATDRFVAAIRDAGIYEMPGVAVGSVGLEPPEGGRRTMQRLWTRATLTAVLLVLGILMLRFRRPALVSLCLVPLTCALGAAVLIMKVVGIELSVMSIAVAPILVGIAVDDGIHMVDRLVNGQALESVLRETGASMTITTLTSVGAFACLGLASFSGIREVAFVGAGGLIVALLASLHLLPIGWQFLRRRQPGVG